MAEARPGGRERILRAAAERISEVGLQALSLKDVAEAADVTIQLIYYHFPNREALVRACLRYAADEAPSVNLLRDAGDVTGLEAIRRALHAEFDETPVVRDENLIWNEITALPIVDAGLRDELDRVTTNWNEQLTIGVLRGIADGSIDSPLAPAELAAVLTATVEGLSQRWLAGLASPDEARRALDELLFALAAAGR